MNSVSLRFKYQSYIKDYHIILNNYIIGNNRNRIEHIAILGGIRTIQSWCENVDLF